MSEKISTAQRVLFLDAVRRGKGEPEATGDEQLAPDELEDADQRLQGASEIDAPKPDDDLEKLRTGKPPRQPHSRAPAPAHLRRIDQLIAVPTEQRACPARGAERACIGHGLAEVIELIPAEVIVRRDRRER